MGELIIAPVPKVYPNPILSHLKVLLTGAAWSLMVQPSWSNLNVTEWFSIC